MGRCREEVWDKGGKEKKKSEEESMEEELRKNAYNRN